jgi:hypothetical protein
MSPGKIKWITVALLSVGFSSALVIYLTTEPAVRNLFYESQLGYKKYVHDLTVMGGKSNVMTAEFIEWFDGLWHGRNLAGTIAVLTVAVTLIFRFIAARPELYRDLPDEAVPAPKHSE